MGEKEENKKREYRERIDEIKDIDDDLQKKDEKDKQQEMKKKKAKKKKKVIKPIKVETENENDTIWNEYISHHGKEPQSASQIQYFAKSPKYRENITYLSYKNAKQILNDNKGKGIIGDNEKITNDDG